ncbi:hypothetical protein AOLI_G00316830 [Acnodon oligacanthus]
MKASSAPAGRQKQKKRASHQPQIGRFLPLRCQPVKERDFWGLSARLRLMSARRPLAVGFARKASRLSVNNQTLRPAEPLTSPLLASSVLS